MMTKERAELELQVECLVEEIGITRAEAERVLEDEDLWMQPAGYRYGFLDAQEDVKQWEIALAFAEALEGGFHCSKAVNEATDQLLCEMRMKAEEALRRAKRRAGANGATEEERA